MSKVSIGRQGIQIETHEKSNVMTSLNGMLLYVGTFSTLLILFGNNFWIQFLGASLIIISAIVFLVIYCCHSVKSPELLQSEKFRIEKHLIEAEMRESKSSELLPKQDIIRTNINLIPDSSDTGDYNE